MSIHTDHPFLPPEGERDPLRRLRGRLAAPVTVWTAELAGRQVGWTVSSMLLAEGQPGEVLGLVDEDSELADVVQQTSRFAGSLLGWHERGLADAFAGTAPAPGGPFRLANWTDTAWGPVLTSGLGWFGARLHSGPLEHAGWALLVRGTIEHVELGAGAEDVLAHLRGRYRRLEL